MENGYGGKGADGSAGPTGVFTAYTTTANFASSPGFVSGATLDMLPQPNEAPIANEFVYHSLTDELIPIAGAQAMVSAWCNEGAKIAFYQAASGDHATTEPDSAPFVIAYFTTIFNAVTPTFPPTTTTCNE